MSEKQAGPLIGAFVAIGAGVGAAMFAATDSPVWIGVGAGAGAAIGAALDANRRSATDQSLSDDADPPTSDEADDVG